MKNINPYFSIIFANTKKEANEIYEIISKDNPTKIGLLHKDLTPRQRKNIFKDINDNKFQYLVATDLAARGLDIIGADIIISMGLPEEDL
jgi:ATP-dependent RNA helicase CshB